MVRIGSGPLSGHSRSISIDLTPFDDDFDNLEELESFDEEDEDCLSYHRIHSIQWIVELICENILRIKKNSK